MKRVIVAAIPLVLAAKVARGQSASGGSSPGVSELYSADALGLLWLPALGSLAIDRYAVPRSSPLYFARTEGGAPPARWEVPIWSLHVAAGGLGVAMLAGGDDSRWYHVKGLAQAMATSALVVSALKPMVGRHRPDWAPDNADGSRNESFPSGHSTNAFVVASYAALYLHGHVFDRDSSAWLQTLAYGGLAVGATLVAGERVFHDRHYLSDVMVGALLGTASSYAMFRLQDHRYAHRGDHETLRITPGFSEQGAFLGLAGAF